MIRQIDHINIVVSDLNSATEFFQLLGFEQGISASLDSNFLGQVTGIVGASGRFSALHHPSGGTIELLEFEANLPAEKNISSANLTGIRHLAFSVDNIEKTVEMLKANGVKFLSPIQTWEKTGKKLVYFLGPDNILLELAEYPQ